MAVSELIQRLVGRRKEREQQARQTFEEVVRALADGESIDEHEVDAMLEACGKMPEQLQLAVETLQQRREAEAKLAEVAAMRPRIKALEDEQAAVAKERNEFVAKCNARIVAASRECERVRLDADQLESWAKRILESSAPGSIAARAAEIHERRTKLAKRQTFLRESLRQGVGGTPAADVYIFGQKAQSLADRGLTETDDYRKHAALLAKAEQQLAANKAELESIKAQLAELDAETAAVEAEKYIA